MKKLILVLTIVMTCSVSFAGLAPEKDGPFPHKIAGLWTSQSGNNKIMIQAVSLKDGKVFLFASLLNSRGEITASGETVLDSGAQWAKIYMVFSGYSEQMVVKFTTVDGPSGPVASLRVTLGNSAASFYRAP